MSKRYQFKKVSLSHCEKCKTIHPQREKCPIHQDSASDDSSTEKKPPLASASTDKTVKSDMKPNIFDSKVSAKRKAPTTRTAKKKPSCTVMPAASASVSIDHDDEVLR